MTVQLSYDKKSIASIFAYSQKLIGHSLRELVSEERQQASNLQGQGKGGLGQMIQELFFNIPLDSYSGPDFRETGMDLKATGLKKLTSGELQIKERLECGMIDYEAVVNETFEASLFYIKCHIMLLIFYLYEKGVSKWDLRYIFTVVWRLPEKDLLIIKHDFEVIVDKIKRGEAHLLSEGDTEYLAASRKGQKDRTFIVNVPSSTNGRHKLKGIQPQNTIRNLNSPRSCHRHHSPNHIRASGWSVKSHPANEHIDARCLHRGVNLQAFALF